MPPMLKTETQAHWDDAGCSTDCFSTPKSPLVELAKKKVRFNTSIDVREVPHLRDLSEGETEATWFSPVEFENIKRKLVVTIRLMMAKKPIDRDQCTRGLEFRTPAGAKMRKQNKLKALTAVWNEQVAQWKDDRTDEEAISFVYQQQVLECRDIARRMAKQDEKDARSYLEGELEESVSDFLSLSLEESAKQSMGEPQRSAVVSTAA